MTHIESVKKQIQENVKILKIRAEKNQESLLNMQKNSFCDSMKTSTKCELSRIAGMIDTYMSCYQMLDNE